MKYLRNYTIQVFFSNLDIKLHNGVLEIKVTENPIIQNLIFNGIKAKKFQDAITEIIDLKEKNFICGK